VKKPCIDVTGLFHLIKVVTLHLLEYPSFFKMAHGGKRENSGRKPRADEISMIDKMDAVAAPEEAWVALWKKVKDGDTQAIKAWLAYRYGQPKQSIDHTTAGDKISIPISEWVKTVK
jgi:hypothetical protein